MDIAFIGMGIMGSAMAANCIKAGHRVTVYNRTAAKTTPLLALGAESAESPAAAARGKEAVLICVEDTPDVEQVLFGPEGVAAGLPAVDSDMEPVLVLDHSTISAEAEAGFAIRLEGSCAARYMDAPVTGGDVGAREGTLTFMCGGEEATFNRALPLLEAMGRRFVHIGPRRGDGQRAKMVNQVVVALNCLATTEGMRLGEAMGLEMTKVLEAIGQGAAGSWSLNNLGPRWLARDFAPGFRLRHLLKDVQFCEQEIGAAEFPGLRQAIELIRRSVEAGNGDLNINAIEKPLL